MEGGTKGVLYCSEGMAKMVEKQFCKATSAPLSRLKFQDLQSPVLNTSLFSVHLLVLVLFID